MSAPGVVLTELVGGDGPLLVAGPSLGTSAAVLWGPCAPVWAGRLRVLAWDLPGHGASPAAEGFTTADLAEAVLAALEERGERGAFAVAGDSLGGAVALEVALAAPARTTAVVVACSGPRIGTPAGWEQRARAVLAGGLRPGGQVHAAAPGRWFGPGFTERRPDLAGRLLDDLAATDPASYAAACRALAGYDVRSRLAGLAAPVLALAGSEDRVTPAALLRHVATGVQDGRLVELDGVAHLAPAEAPELVADLVAGHVERAAGSSRTAGTVAAVRAQGMRVRREVLGDEHVDRATAAATALTADFQDLITTFAWGSVWTRPGLDRRSRSVAALTAMVARGHHEELAMHVRAALRNGLSAQEVQEVLLQSAVYCGVPDANTAFRIAAGVLAEDALRADASPGGGAPAPG